MASQLNIVCVCYLDALRLKSQLLPKLFARLLYGYRDVLSRRLATRTSILTIDSILTTDGVAIIWDKMLGSVEF